MAEKGYIRLSRGFFDTRLWTEPRVYSRAEAWLDLIQMARFESTTEIITNREIEVGRGEIPASRRFLETRWQWSNTKVENYLKHLQKRQQITLRNANGHTVISLCNYEKYNPRSREQNARDPSQETPPERQQNASETPNIKNLNKESNIINPPIIPPLGENDLNKFLISKISGRAVCDSLTQKGEKCGKTAKLNIGGNNYCGQHARMELEKLGILEVVEKEQKINLDFAPEEFRLLILDWLSYKKARKQSYKTPQSIQLFYKELMKISGGKLEKAKDLIEKSIANNWSGIHEITTNNYAVRQDNRRDFGAGEKNYDKKSTLI